ncbi:MICOS complex subunit MIC10-like [Glossina fuscipes fuscipes]
MTASSTKINYAEDEYGKKLDRCVTDGIIKSTGGFLIGTVLSLTFFKRKAWPILVATGFGAGMAYRTCEKELNK